MGILFKIILALVLLGFLGLLGFSYYPGSLVPQQATVSQPVTLNVD